MTDSHCLRHKMLERLRTAETTLAERARALREWWVCDLLTALHRLSPPAAPERALARALEHLEQHERFRDSVTPPMGGRLAWPEIPPLAQMARAAEEWVASWREGSTGGASGAPTWRYEASGERHDGARLPELLDRYMEALRQYQQLWRLAREPDAATGGGATGRVTR